jgi:cation:H+ antiporter
MIWVLVFIVSCLILFFSGSRLVNSLTKIARYLGWREFVVAFFIVAIAGAAPNIFVGISAALQGVPELSFGDVVGGNVIDMTLAVALAILISGNPISVKSRMVQTSTMFTVVIAVLPWILMLDGSLTRSDGLILLLAFLTYIFWLFSKEERFRKEYKTKKSNQKGLKFAEFVKKDSVDRAFKKFILFLKNLGAAFLYLFLLLIAAIGVVKSAQFFASYLGVAVPMIGILIVGLGNALPETYFAIVSARKGRTWMILGDLMGSVIVCATFVLGLVVLIHPIKNVDFSPFVIARIFLVLSALLFLVFIKTDRKITRTEAALLLALYLIFLFTELAFH